MIGRRVFRCNGLCCFCILYNTIFWFVIACFIFWLIFLPQEPKFTVTNASLTQFNFNTTNATLSYNLTLNITIRNPNKRVGIYYRRIQVIGNYRKKRFALVTLTNSTPFYQGHKNTTVLHQVLVQGQQLVRFGEREVSQFNSETAAGVYSIDVQLALRIRARYGKFRTSNYKPYRRSDCKLKVSLTASNGTSASSSGFRSTKCGSAYLFSDPDATAST